MRNERESPEPGAPTQDDGTPPGDVDTASGTVRPGTDPDSDPTDGTDTMTAAEQSGQVAYGAREPVGETGATGAESSSG